MVKEIIQGNQMVRKSPRKSPENKAENDEFPSVQKNDTLDPSCIDINEEAFNFSALKQELIGKLKGADEGDIRSIALTLDSLTKLTLAESKYRASLDKSESMEFTEIFLDKWKNDR